MKGSGFDECVGITRSIMNLFSIWPDTKSSDHWYSRYNKCLVPLFFLNFFIIIPQTRMLIVVWGDLNHMLELLMTGILAFVIASIKIFAICCNKQDLSDLLTRMAEDWKIATKQQQHVMWQKVRLIRLITTFYTVIVLGVAVAYTMLMLVILKFHMDEEKGFVNASITKPMFFKAKFFFETLKSPIFEIIWISQFAAMMMGAISFLSFDCFFICVVMHLCGQLTNLQFDLKYLTLKMKTSNFREIERSIISKHVHLQRFACGIEDSCNKVFLIQMVCYSVMIGLQGYQIITILTDGKKKDMANLVYITIYAINNLDSIFVYCLIAELLRTESTNVFFAACEMKWYQLSPQESKMLLFILHNTKEPLNITAGKFVSLSFEYFIAILKTAGGYLSMLLAVKSRH